MTDAKGSVTVLIDGKGSRSGTQAYANNTYQRWDIPVGKWRGQKGVTMTIKGHESQPAYHRHRLLRLLFDDFTVTPSDDARLRSRSPGWGCAGRARPHCGLDVRRRTP